MVVHIVYSLTRISNSEDKNRPLKNTDRKTLTGPVWEKLFTYSRSYLAIAFVHALKLNQRKRGKLCSVVKITKNTAVSTHLNVSFFHSALSCCSCSITGKIAINGDCNDDFSCELKEMYEGVFFYSKLSSDFMLVPHTFINLTGEKISNVQLPFSCRSAAAAILESEKTLRTRLTRVFTALARISKRGCQTRFIRSITTRTEMTCIGWTENKNKNKTYFSLHRFVILFFDEVLIQ